MNYSDSNLNKAKPKWLLQSVSDMNRMEGFREYPYPDPLSKLGKRYRPAEKYGWGFMPADALLAKYGEKVADGAPWTIGAGFTKNVKVSDRMTRFYSDKRLEDEIITRSRDLVKLFPEWEESWPLFAQTVVINLAYNLGFDGLSKFHGTINALNARQWADAASHLEDSLWYKQVGSRGKELVARLRDQQIDPKYKIV